MSDFWFYKMRCVVCRHMYEVQSLERASNTWKEFDTMIRTIEPKRRYLLCEKCDLVTLQTLVAWEAQPEDGGG